MSRVSIQGAIGLICLAAAWPSNSPAKDIKVVLLAGTKSHAPGEHEYEKGLNLLRHCLDTALNVRHVIVEVHTRGWPVDERTLDDADTIVLFGDGGSRSAQHPLVAGHHMPALAKQMQRGCGLVVIHWSLNLPSKIGNETFLRWIGGFKDYEDPPRPIGEPLRVDDWSKQASHPICRGLKPFEMPKDEYKTPERLLSDKPGFVPILPFPGKPGSPLWAWAWQREDGGRGFGLIGGHNHTIWEIEDLRKAVLNAILWTAKKPVPSDGVISSLPPAPTAPPEPVFIPVKIDGPVHNPAIGSYWYGPFNESCSLVDVNGDGRLDITCGVHWYEASNWKKHPYYFDGAEQRNFLHGHCHETAMDVNRDGLVDVVNSGYQPDIAGVLWYENPGPRGGKWKVRRVHASPFIEGILPADLNGDGRADIIAGNGHGYGLDWFQQRIDGQGKRAFQRHAIEEHYANFHTMVLADVNGDGKLDIVVAGRGGLYAFINRGLTPIPKSANPKVPMIGEKHADSK